MATLGLEGEDSGGYLTFIEILLLISGDGYCHISNTLNHSQILKNAISSSPEMLSGTLKNLFVRHFANNVVAFCLLDLGDFSEKNSSASFFKETTSKCFQIFDGRLPKHSHLVLLL